MSTTTTTNPLRVGLRQERVIPAQCLVIFGASGDLTHRKLVPALFELFLQRRLPSEFAVLGCARRAWSDEDFRSKMAEAMQTRVEENREAWEQFSSGMFYEPVDLQQPEHLVKLGGRLEAIDRLRATRSNRTFYLSVSPKFYGSGCRALADAGLLRDPERSRVVIEKPFGRDYSSAQSLNKVVQACGQENQIFRIDHYLGKETVQNIMVLRFANTIFEPLWNRNYISSVQITAAETVGVEERAAGLSHACTGSPGTRAATSRSAAPTRTRSSSVWSGPLGSTSPVAAKRVACGKSPRASRCGDSARQG